MPNKLSPSDKTMWPDWKEELRARKIQKEHLKKLNQKRLREHLRYQPIRNPCHDGLEWIQWSKSTTIYEIKKAAAIEYKDDAMETLRSEKNRFKSLRMHVENNKLILWDLSCPDWIVAPHSKRKKSQYRITNKDGCISVVWDKINKAAQSVIVDEILKVAKVKFRQILDKNLVLYFKRDKLVLQQSQTLCSRA